MTMLHGLRNLSHLTITGRWRSASVLIENLNVSHVCFICVDGSNFGETDVTIDFRTLPNLTHLMVLNPVRSFRYIGTPSSLHVLSIQGPLPHEFINECINLRHLHVMKSPDIPVLNLPNLEVLEFGDHAMSASWVRQCKLHKLKHYLEKGEIHMPQDRITDALNEHIQKLETVVIVQEMPLIPEQSEVLHTLCDRSRIESQKALIAKMDDMYDHHALKRGYLAAWIGMSSGKRDWGWFDTNIGTETESWVRYSQNLLATDKGNIFIQTRVCALAEEDWIASRVPEESFQYKYPSDLDQFSCLALTTYSCNDTFRFSYMDVVHLTSRKSRVLSRAQYNLPGRKFFMKRKAKVEEVS